jgi:hypothetical protein
VIITFEADIILFQKMAKFKSKLSDAVGDVNFEKEYFEKGAFQGQER